jgi:hypothetical protein
MAEATTAAHPTPHSGGPKPRTRRTAWRRFRRGLRAIAWPTFACITFLIVDGVHALADRFDCQLLQRDSAPWQGWLVVFEPLRDAASATAFAACDQGQGVRLVLAALWAFTLALFLLSLATVVLRSWPKDLKQWVDRFASMIVDAFASGLGEAGRARAQGAATAVTWLLALAAPAYALGQLPSIDRGPGSSTHGDAKVEAPAPSPPSEHERAVAQSLARIERFLASPPAPPQPINLHIASPPTAPPSGHDAGRALREARTALEESLRVHQAPLAEAAKATMARTEALDARLRAVEADDQRLAAIREGLADLSAADRKRLEHESKPLLARWRDNLLGRGSGCATACEGAAASTGPAPAVSATSGRIVDTTRVSPPLPSDTTGPHELRP